jgi:hypothetical protein
MSNVCGGSRDLLCLDLSLKMQLVIFTSAFGGLSNRFDPASEWGWGGRDQLSSSGLKAQLTCPIPPTVPK